MRERERMDKAVKLLLLGPCKRGFEVSLRCGGRNFPLQGEFDWNWLSSQQGKVDLIFREDPIQPPLDMATVVTLERQVLRRRKRWGILQTTANSCHIIQPSKMTTKWLASRKEADFKLMLHTRTEVATRYQVEQTVLSQRQKRTDYRMIKIPEVVLSSSVL